MLGTLARFCAAAAVLAFASLAPDAQARSLDDIIKSGSIRVGVNPNFPPMSSYGKTNQLEGFDIDIGNKIADALKVKADFVPTETPQRVPFLTADRIDISLGALTRTAERAKLIDFTVPLHTEAMAVLTTDKEPLTKWLDFNKPARQLDGRLPQGEAAASQAAADGHHRGHGAGGGAGPRERDHREHRLLHVLHEELSRCEVEGARRHDLRRLRLDRRAARQR
ncbi:MAG: transporter substrate-binding domain-containing protein [Burkholderia sp.]|nr:transporter substrate-binding domain-containing protein [Burkholderia sp.]